MTNETPTNIANITDKQPQPSCRFSIQATLRGFPITVEGEGRAGDLKLIVERLLAAGAEPPAAKASTPEPTSEDAPICEFHGKMKRGNYGWFCPKRMGDGSYCKSKW